VTPVPGRCLKCADIMSGDKLRVQKTRLQNQVVCLTDNGQTPSDARLAVTLSEQELISSKRSRDLVLDEDCISRAIRNQDVGSLLRDVRAHQIPE